MKSLPVHIPQKDIVRFCIVNHIKSISVFGSALTDQFKSSSDVDFLVKFNKDNIPTLFDVAHMESELTQIIGRKADLKTAEDLSPYFRDQIIQQAYLLYEQ